MKILVNISPTTLFVVFASLTAVTSPGSAQPPLSLPNSGVAPRNSLDSQFRQLLIANDAPTSVQWSPDSAQIGYVAIRSGSAPALPELFVMNARTGDKHCVLNASALTATLGVHSTTLRALTAGSEHLSFAWSPDTRSLLVLVPPKLYWLDLSNGKLRPIVEGEQPVSDPKFSPDGRAISFVQNHTLFAVDLKTGNRQQISGTGSENMLEGELDWAYGNAFDVKTAYWWSPDSSAIAYLQTSEQDVHRFRLPELEEDSGESQTIAFPLPGKSIPVTRPFLFEFGGGLARPLLPSTQLEGYIPVLRWLPSSQWLAWEHLNRAQNKIELISYNRKTGATKSILSDEDKYWINIFDFLPWTPSADRFIWASERSGFRHLYLYGATGKMLSQITSGDWEVTSIEAVDDTKVYFTGTQKSPRERHLFRVNLDGTELKKISLEAGTHQAQISPDAQFYVDQFSTASSPPSWRVHRLSDGAPQTLVYENPLWLNLKSSAASVEFLSLNTHTGLPLDAVMIKPPDFQASRKYPLIVHLFSGPGTQVAADQWDPEASAWHQAMALQGFIICAVDTRGAGGHGHLFEEPLHFRLSAQEMGDQRDVLTVLRAMPFIDPSRVGVWGAGYGGFLALHAMMDRPVGYKAGFAIAPIAEWDQTNALFAERYLDTPQRNRNGYESSSPTNELRGYKAELLIAQGLRDRQVHLSQTLQVLKVLVDFGATADLALFPEAEHLIDRPADRDVLFQRATDFFRRHLR